MEMNMDGMKVNELLKARREAKRLPLQSVHRETRISMVYLEALESGSWETFPAEVYLLGFMRKYASFLGLKPEEVVGMYTRELEAKKAEAAENEKRETEIKRGGETRLLAKEFAFFAVLIVVGVWWGVSVYKSGAKQAEKIASPHLKTKLASPTLVESEPLSLNMKCLSNVWVRVMEDQALAFEGFLAPGSTHKWDAQKEIFVRVGNVAAVQAWLNNRPVNLARNSKGGVTEIQISSQFLSDDGNFLGAASAVHEPR